MVLMAAGRKPEQMMRAKLPFVGSQHNRTSASTKDSLFMNCYLEKIRDAVEGQQESNTYYLVGRPGYGSGTQVAPSPAEGRGVYYWWKNSKTYSAFGNKLYSNTTEILTLQNSTGKVGFDEILTTTNYLVVSDGVKIYLINSSDSVTTVSNGTIIEIEITAGGSGYVSNPTVSLTGGGGSGATATATIASGAVSTITITNAGSGYTSAPTVSFSGGGGSGAAAVAYVNSLPTSHIPQPVCLDNYVFVAEASTEKIWNSEVLEPTKWYSDAYVSAENHPDKLIGIARYQNNIVALGESTTEFFYDAANATGSPLTRNDQVSNQLGCAAERATVRIENNMIYLAKTKAGGYSVVSLDGYTPKVVSTEPIEKIINAEGSSISSAYAWKFKQNGHIFYVLNLSSQSRTLVYDLRESEWHEWTETVSASPTKFQAVDATDADGTIRMQHITSGYNFTVSHGTYQDNGTAISIKYVSPLFDGGTLKRKFMSRLEIAGDKLSSSANLSVRYSDDDYSTWSTARTIDLSNMHQYLVRLGSFRRRAFELTFSSNQPFRLEAMEFELELGEF
jgi:hypothetical protein